MTDHLPLSEHVVLETSDLAEVNRLMQRELPTRRLSFATERRRLAARLHAVPLPSVTPMYVAYGGDVVDVLAEDGPFYFVHVPLTGRVVMTCDEQEFTPTSGSVAVASPTESLELRWHPDATAMVFRIDRRALEGALVDLIRLPVEEPLRFQHRMDVASQPGASWVRAAMFLADELNQTGGVVSHPMIATDLQRMIMRGLLLSQPHTYTAALADERAAATLPPHIAAAVALIETAPERPLTAETLAREVNVSPRLLQAGFREHLGVSPMQHLRNERLRRVREDLTGSDPARRPTIAEVAYRWGFTHLGRFAHDYRARYGESPSITLRRH
jgi:AraC-like DNA-binding protein